MLYTKMTLQCSVKPERDSKCHLCLPDGPSTHQRTHLAQSSLLCAQSPLRKEPLLCSFPQVLVTQSILYRDQHDQDICSSVQSRSQRQSEMILFIGSSVVKKRSLISTLKRLNGSRKEKGSNIGVFSATQLISFVPLNIQELYLERI